jgi:hypothetical protein
MKRLKVGDIYTDTNTNKQYKVEQAQNGCCGCAFNVPSKTSIKQCMSTPECGSVTRPPQIIYTETAQ